MSRIEVPCAGRTSAACRPFLCGAMFAAGLALPAAAIAGPLVAVFPLDDARSGDAHLKPQEASGLTEQLIGALGQGKVYSVVPMATIQSAIDYNRKVCTERACQVELAKGLAAAKVLATKLTGSGVTCLLTSTLYDVRKSAVEKSFAERGSCSTVALTSGLKTIAAKLSGRMGAGKGEPAGPATPEGMVQVAAGEFIYGCNKKADQECIPGNESWALHGQLPAFLVDRLEVTVEAYTACVKAGACTAKDLDTAFVDGRVEPEFAEFCNWGKEGREHHPINCIDWNQAEAYCRFVKKRLPREAEWEKAARGVDGRKYPWGNEPFNAKKPGNIADAAVLVHFPGWPAAPGYDDGFAGTAPVGSFPAGASPYGALDMVGNVAEWTSDWYEEGKYRVVRGGAWNSPPMIARISHRNGYEPWSRYAFIGFRCVQ